MPGSARAAHRGDMTRVDAPTTAAAAFAAGALLIGLTACAQIADVFHKQHREEFATYDAAAAGWVGVGIPDWIPADATELRNLATTDETVSVIRVTTDSPLAGACAPAPREGLAQLTADWVPNDRPLEEWPDEVERCGPYEVVPMDDGWLGWFQATTPGQTPEG